MLNPFAIEKSLIEKTEALKDRLVKLKSAIATSVLSSNLGNIMDAQFISKCQQLKDSIDISKLYVCKVCGRQFDQGRKLGGHVSRAHKDFESSNSYISSDQYQQPETPVVRKGRKLKKEQPKVEQAAKEQDKELLKDQYEVSKVKQEPIFEPDP